MKKSRYADPRNGAPLDLVLCDVEMPVMDGLEFMKTVRDMEARGVAFQDYDLPNRTAYQETCASIARAAS